MIVIGKRYTDAMDATRTVVPVDLTGRCRIYFDNEFVGFAKCSPRLFRDEGADSFYTAQELRIGFLPTAPAEA